MPAGFLEHTLTTSVHWHNGAAALPLRARDCICKVATFKKMPDEQLVFKLAPEPWVLQTLPSVSLPVPAVTSLSHDSRMIHEIIPYQQPMEALLGSQTSVSLTDSVTVLSPAAILNAGYTSFRLRDSQLSLQQPWQRSSSAGSKRQLNGLPREQQQQQPARSEADSGSQQQHQQHHVQTILRAHQELLAAVTAACAQAGAAAVEQAPDSAACASATAEPSQDASAAAATNNSKDAAGPPVLQAVAAAAADIEHAATDWTVLAGMKHTLKPKLHFQCSTAQGQQQVTQSKLFDAFVHNPSSSEVVAAAYDRQVLLPAGCGFCMSDLKAMQPFVKGKSTA
jgi:hypothetical protein